MAKTKQATFAMGCFWKPQLLFEEIQGVVKTEVGYMGGHKDSPSYEEVCDDDTGHAEVVHVEYDPDQVSYNDLLDVFWKNHNPTQHNRQGPDVGSQYRTAIFFYDDEQEQAAQMSKKKEQKKYDALIDTQIVPASTFYRAEDYHQHYLKKRGKNTC